ncbi:oligogalacturonate lyase family protein [Paenibacillus piri]|nr:oligogalacturonate lyase family protein [Paenibacillus piri]
MGVGRIWKDEVFRYKDPVSGRTVTKLTNYLGHSHHLYFTDPCFFNEGRSFVFLSDRENSANVFRYDLETATITQLTDLQTTITPRGYYSLINHAYYFWLETKLYELKVDTYRLRVLYEAPDDFVPRHTLSVTADGKYVCTLLQWKKDVEPKGEKSISYSYSRFIELYEAFPLSCIVKIEVSTGKMDVLHEDRNHMGHVNTSPTRPDLLTFCHEGPGIRVKQRIWGMDVNTGKVWKLREQNGEAAVVHEYWFADGETIGYHGRMLPDQHPNFFGAVKWDGSEQMEYNFPFKSTHFASNDLDLMVGDGTSAFAHNAKPYIMLFKRDGDTYTGPRILSMHRSTFNDQYAHPHPRFTPDGKQIMYTSDLTSYSNIYLVDIGDFEDLPELK